MATTLKEINTWLDEQEINYMYDEEDDVIIFPATDGEVETAHFMNLQKEKDGKYYFNYNLRLRENDDFLKIKNDHPHLQKVLAYCMEQNYSTKVGRWAYYPDNNELKYDVSMFLDERGISKEQFNNIFLIMYILSDDAIHDIFSILEDGKIPEQDNETIMEESKSEKIFEFEEDDGI